MAGEKTARIFDLMTAFKHRFHQIAKAAKNSNNNGKYHPIHQIEFWNVKAEDISHQKSYCHAPHRTFPGFLRRNSWKKWRFTPLRTDKVSHRIIRPSHQQQTKYSSGIEIFARKGDEIEQGKGNADVEKAQYEIGYIREGLFRLCVQLKNEAQKDEGRKKQGRHDNEAFPVWNEIQLYDRSQYKGHNS